MKLREMTLTSVLTCITPSSVRVLVSITENPSARKVSNIFYNRNIIPKN